MLKHVALNSCIITIAFVVTGTASGGEAPGTTTRNVPAGTMRTIVPPWNPRAIGYEEFIARVYHLNMTPQLSLSPQTKQVLQSLTEEYHRAEAEYRSEVRTRVAELYKELRAALRVGDQAKAQEIREKWPMESDRSRGLDDEYVAKVLVQLSREERELVEKTVRAEILERDALDPRFKKADDAAAARAASTRSLTQPGQ